MSAVDDIFSKWNKDAKYELAKTGVVWEDIERIPFSSPRCSYILYGGLPAVGISEFSGPEGAGKTLAALDIVANAQKKWPDRDVVWFDIETTFDSRWAAKQGVNINKLKYVCPQEEYAETIFDMMVQLLENNDTDISLMVLDSVAALISKQDYEKSQEQATMGGIAKPLTRFCNRIAPLLRKKKCALIVINQVRDDMNSMYGGLTTPGGRGLRHSAVVRLEFRRSDFFDENGNVVSTAAENPAGHKVKIKVLKTKVCRPDRKVGFYTLRYLDGIDYITDLIDVGVLLEVFDKRGAWYYAPDENGELQGYQGKAKFESYLRDNPDMVAKFQQNIYTMLTIQDDEEKAAYYQSILEPDNDSAE